MKSSTELRLGERCSAQVVERLSSSEYIVAVDGQLMRVQNQTKNVWRQNDFVDLILISLNPMTFRMGPKRYSNRIDQMA